MANKFLTNIELDGDLIDINGNSGTAGQVLSSLGSGNGVDWIDIASDTAERIEVTVKNVSGGSLSKGTVVHASPSATPPSGNVIEVIAADYDDSTKMPAIGILNETIANEGEGSAVMMGAVSGIDTSSFSIGDELYVGNLGALTNTKPATAGQLIQKIAVVIKSHASNGLIKIFGAGRSNDVPLPLYIDNTNQRVGIGDSTPSYTLDVNGTIYGSGVRSGRYYGTSGTSSYLDLDSGAPYSLLASSEINVTNTIVCNDLEATEVGGIAASNGPVYGLRFYGYGNTTYYVDPNDSTTSAILNGKVGIGTTSPTYKFEVSNGTQTGTFNPNSSGFMFLGSTSNHPLYFGVNDSTKMAIDTAGNVGIGTTSPINGGGNAKWITIDATSANSYSGGVIYSIGGSAKAYHYVENDYLIHQGQSNVGHKFVTNGTTERLRIGPSGQIGIGGANYGTSGQVLTSNGSGSAPSWQNASGSSNWTLSGNDIYNNNSGNVGIGTSSPSQKLHVNGRGLFQTGGSTADATTGTYEKGITLTGGNMRLVIDTSNVTNGGSYIQTRHSSTTYPNAYYTLALNPLGGKVGIGTTSPSQKLEVNGTAKANEFVSLVNTSNSGITRDWTIIGTGDRGAALEIADISGAKYAIYAGGYDLTFGKHVSSNNTYTTAMAIYAANATDASPYVQATHSFRAPIFYDSNNTGYYVDPASLSVINDLDLKENGIQRWYRSGGSAHQRVDARLDGTDQARMHWYGKDDSQNTRNFKHAWYDGGSYINVTAASDFIYFAETSGTVSVQSDGSFRAPIFYDSNNTGYYLDPAGTSQVNNVTMNGELILDSAGGTTKFIAGSSDRADFVGQNVVLSGWNGLGFYNPTSGGAYANQTTAFYDFRNGIFSVKGSHRAPIFYDTNNTSYYTDPAGTSNIQKLIVNTYGTGVTRQLTIKENSDTDNSMGHYPGAWTSALNIQSNDNSTYLWLSPLTSNIPRVQTNYGQLDFYTGNNTNRALHLSGTTARSSTFYDIDNTSYYINPASTGIAAYLRGDIEIINEQPLLELNDYTATSTTNLNAWVSFQYNGTEGGYVGYGSDSNSNLYLYNFNGDVLINGSKAETNNSFRAPIFYDSNDTGYYVDPNSTSRSARLRGEIYVGPNTSSKYLRLGGNGGNTDVSTISTSNGNLHIDATSGYNLYLAWYNTSDVMIGGQVQATAYYDRNNTAYVVNPNGNSNLLSLNLGGYDQNAPIMGEWYSTGAYVYIAPTIYYYYIKVANLASNTSIGNLEYYCKKDSNYPGAVSGKVSVATYSASSMSVQHDQIGGNGEMTPQVILDNNRDVWLRMAGAAWNHEFRWRWTYNSGVTTYDGSTKQTTQPSNSDVIDAGEAYRYAWNNVSSSNVYDNRSTVYSLSASLDTRSPIFYDSGNSAYSLNPSSGSTGYWQVNTPSGYLQIGPQDANYCHFTTDRLSGYVFNKKIQVGQGTLRSDNQDLVLTRNGSSTARIVIGSGETRNDQNMKIVGTSGNDAVLTLKDGNTSGYIGSEINFTNTNDSQGGRIQYLSNPGASEMRIYTEGHTTNYSVRFKTADTYFNDKVHANQFIGQTYVITGSVDHTYQNSYAYWYYNWHQSTSFSSTRYAENSFVAPFDGYIGKFYHRGVGLDSSSATALSVIAEINGAYNNMGSGTLSGSGSNKIFTWTNTSSTTLDFNEGDRIEMKWNINALFGESCYAVELVRKPT